MGRVYGDVFKKNSAKHKEKHPDLNFALTLCWLTTHLSSLLISAQVCSTSAVPMFVSWQNRASKRASWINSYWTCVDIIGSIVTSHSKGHISTLLCHVFPMLFKCLVLSGDLN